MHLHFSLSPVSSPSIFSDVFLPCSSFSSISPVHLSLPCHPVTTLSLAAPQPADPSHTQGLFLCYSVCAQLRAKVSTPNYKGDGEERKRQVSRRKIYLFLRKKKEKGGKKAKADTGIIFSKANGTQTHTDTYINAHSWGLFFPLAKVTFFICSFGGFPAGFTLSLFPLYLPSSIETISQGTPLWTLCYCDQHNWNTRHRDWETIMYTHTQTHRQDE